VSSAPEVRLELPSRPGSVGVVRQALAGVADALGMDEAITADAKMAISEACTNVVVHAYDGHAGSLAVELRTGQDALEVVVADHGRGAEATAGSEHGEHAGLGLGLPLMAALADRFELEGPRGEGTRVTMSFRYERESDPAGAGPVRGRERRPGTSG